MDSANPTGDIAEAGKKKKKGTVRGKKPSLELDREEETTAGQPASEALEQSLIEIRLSTERQFVEVFQRLQKLETAEPASDQKGLCNGSADGPERSPQTVATDGVTIAIANANQDATSIEDEAGDVPREIKQAPISDGERLDRADKYANEESVWNALLLIGLPVLGHGTSAFLALLGCIFVTLQLLFSWIVITKMSSLYVTEATLMNLLQYRMGIAHSVKWADVVNRRSMATQLCAEDQRMHISSAQMDMYSGLKSFEDGGALLCILIQFCWLLIVVNEINKTLHWCQGIVSIPRGSTCLAIGGNDEGADKTAFFQLETIQVKQISKMRVYLLLLLCCIPRLVIAGTLWYSGVQFLMSSKSHGDLILNGVALGFILDLDEFVYSVLVPQRVKTIVSNLEPVPLHRISSVRAAFRSKCPCGLAIMQMLVMTSIMIIVYFTSVAPLFRNIAEAQEVLCGGTQNFVFTENSASSVVYAVRTPTDSNFTQSEKDVLQMAAPALDRKLWPKLDQSIFDLTLSPHRKAIIMPDRYAGLMRDAEVADPGYFELVKVMESSSAEDNAEILDCVDYENAGSQEVAIERLRIVTGDTSIENCSAAIAYCEEYDYSTVRALCPRTCGCDTTISSGSSSGFFGSPHFGCPYSCGIRLKTNEETWIAANDTAAVQPCTDLSNDNWDIRDTAIQFYVWGLFEYLTKDDPDYFSRHLEDTLPQFEEFGIFRLSDYGVEPSQWTAALLDGTIRDSWQQFNWTLGPGIYHPRSMEGCQFLTSYEVIAILGINLCDVGWYRSIRAICPVSCGCVAQPQAGAECPASCNYPANRDNFEQIAQFNWVTPPAVATSPSPSP